MMSTTVVLHIDFMGFAGIPPSLRLIGGIPSPVCLSFNSLFLVNEKGV